jgi:hypothetical protein
MAKCFNNKNFSTLLNTWHLYTEYVICMKGEFQWLKQIIMRLNKLNNERQKHANTVWEWQLFLLRKRGIWKLSWPVTILWLWCNSLYD